MDWKVVQFLTGLGPRATKSEGYFISIAILCHIKHEVWWRGCSFDADIMQRTNIQFQPRWVMAKALGTDALWDVPLGWNNNKSDLVG